MQRRLSITSVGLTISATLVVIYTLVMLGSLLLVGLRTTGSWQAALLGIGWSTLVGFVIGFLGIVIAGFAVALLFSQIRNSLQRPGAGKSKTQTQASQSDLGTAKFWKVRLLAACLVLPPLALFGLRALASIGILGAPPSGSGAKTQSPGLQRRPVSLSPLINTVHRETEPSFTADGRTMYFNCNSGDICVSSLSGPWEEGNWSPPERLGAPISTAYEEIEPVINGTGDQLYFTSRRPGGRLWGIPFLAPFMDAFRVANTLATAKLGRTFFGGLGMPDIYVSSWVDGAWSEPRNLNDIAGAPPVNTEFEDHCLFFSPDGKEVFWTSTRPGGYGGNDIWTSRLVGSNWTHPENLGPNVNGLGSEHTSIPAPNGRSLYVTATRPDGFGNEDIYITTRGAEGTWGSLLNLGPMVNGPGDDRCPAWTPDLKIFLFDSVREGGFGARDIWWISFKDIMGNPFTAVLDSESILGSQ